MAITLIRRRRSGAAGGSASEVRRAVAAVLAAEGAAGRDVAVLLTDDREIRTLNREHRGKDKPTDVLAFALDEGPPVPGAAGELGDVIISVERARQQSGSRRVTLDAELELLAVHGTLHLLGYDHGEAAEARVMRARTRAIRRALAAERRPVRPGPGGVAGPPCAAGPPRSVGSGKTKAKVGGPRTRR